MTQHIHQEAVIEAPPAAVYAALTDAAKFSAMSGGAPSQIDATDGGAFSCFGGMILGRNIECVGGERLVQAWRVKAWDRGQYSLVRFEMKAEGTATRLVLDHTGFPEGQAEHLAEGWQTNYFGPLKAALEA